MSHPFGSPSFGVGVPKDQQEKASWAKRGPASSEKPMGVGAKRRAEASVLLDTWRQASRRFE